MSDHLDPLVGWPSQPPAGYLGQLEPAFQEARAVHYADITADDCNWYHTVALPDGTVHEGEWDLRGSEKAYLGNIDLAGKTVLEFGPASGWLSFWMESQGASVTSFEAGYDAAIHLVPPLDGTDLAAAQDGLMEHTRRTTNAWWYQHRLRGSSNRLLHGDLYNLPKDLGQFDIVVLGSILLHVRDTARALDQATSHASSLVVVVEPSFAGMSDDATTTRVVPGVHDTGPGVVWWRFSPGAVAALLWRFGFNRERVVRHTQKYRDASGQYVDAAQFSVVAKRMTTPQSAPPAWLLRASRPSVPQRVLERVRARLR